MKSKNIIRGPVLQTSSGLVYSVTLLSGHIVTSPAGFGVDVELTPPISETDTNNTHRLEDYAPGANREEVHKALRHIATTQKP